MNFNTLVLCLVVVTTFGQDFDDYFDTFDMVTTNIPPTTSTTETTTERTTELTTEPATERTTELTTEPTTEPTTERTTELTTEPTTEPTTSTTTAPTLLKTSASFEEDMRKEFLKLESKIDRFINLMTKTTTTPFLTPEETTTTTASTIEKITTTKTTTTAIVPPKINRLANEDVFDDQFFDETEHKPKTTTTTVSPKLNRLADDVFDDKFFDEKTVEEKEKKEGEEWTTQKPKWLPPLIGLTVSTLPILSLVIFCGLLACCLEKRGLKTCCNREKAKRGKQEESEEEKERKINLHIYNEVDETSSFPDIDADADDTINPRPPSQNGSEKEENVYEYGDRALTPVNVFKIKCGYIRKGNKGPMESSM